MAAAFAPPASSLGWFVPGFVLNGIEILCQEVVFPKTRGIWSDKNFYLQSHTPLISLEFTAILVATTTLCFILKPLRIPFVPQITAGVLIGIVFSKLNASVFLSKPTQYILTTFSRLGFAFNLFTLGVQSNRVAIKSVGKKSIFIALTGLGTSLGIAYAAYTTVKGAFPPMSLVPQMLMNYNALNFLMVTCSHLNDLGISNTDLGHLAAATAIPIDFLIISLSIIVYQIIRPLVLNISTFKPILIIVYLFMVFVVFRPIVNYIIRLTPEGRPMKQTHFLLILAILFFISFCGELADDKAILFLFAFSLPEEPLGSVLTERLDSFNNAVFLPLFCAVHGMRANVNSLSKNSYVPEIILLAGHLGKFFGILGAGLISGLVFSNSMALAIIMSSKGLMDIFTVGMYRDVPFGFNDEQYTVVLIHAVVTTGLFLPCVRYLYTPSRQYSTILRRSVIESCENGSFHTLACIHKEETVPGIIHLLEMCYPSRPNPVSVVGLQLMQLTGRGSLPYMAPLDQVTSSSAFRSNLARCNRIVNAFLHFEREYKGNTFLQHYVAVSPFLTMHNDICKLAYEKNVNIIIVPFHVRWAPNGEIQESSTSIRDVNTRVLEKAPCSVGLFIDRGLMTTNQSKLKVDDGRFYHVALLFIGGGDDHEALAYSRLLVRHPNVKLSVLWLKGPQDDDFKGLDYDVIEQFRRKSAGNDKTSFREIVVNDGSETVQTVVSMKDDVDLVVMGKHHDPKCLPVNGLSDGWGDYPELGIIGDVLASPDFRFSMLVVQQEPRFDSNVDIFDDM